MYIKLPNHIEDRKVEWLVTSLERWLLTVSEVEAYNLHPTTRAARLAAEAAVCVLLAHEIGQEVGDANLLPAT